MARLPVVRPARVPTFVVFVMALCAAQALAADCPDAEIRMSTSSDPYLDPRAALDTTRIESGFTSRVFYDLPAGTVGLSASPADGEHVHVTLADEYVLVGPAVGTVVTVEAILDFEGSIGTPGCAGSGCGAQFRAILLDEFFNAMKAVDAPASSGDTRAEDSLPLSVRFTVGTPKVIYFGFELRTGAGAHHGGDWAGGLRFTGLPPGAHILSCSGYGGATEVRPATWGRIKTLYR
jgi:hypothetical protein